MAESLYSPVCPLDGGHDRGVFDCGAPALNLYLRQYALQNQKRGIVRNYVTTRKDDKIVVAYYSLVYASLPQKLLPAKLIKGLGKALLKNAILRTMQAAEIAGLKLLLVQAKDEAAANFYRKHGFEPVLGDPLKLFLPVPLSP